MFHENWYSDAQVGDLQLLVDKVSKGLSVDFFQSKTTCGD